MQVRKFVEIIKITDNDEARANGYPVKAIFFPGEDDIKLTNNGWSALIEGEEWQFVVSVGGMQDGTTSWAVTFNWVDNPIRVASGECKPPMEKSSEQRFSKTESEAEYQINRAIQDMTSSWLRDYLPPFVDMPTSVAPVRKVAAKDLDEAYARRSK